MDKLITVIMPAYNAQRTIELALKSIRMQTIPQEEIEILVIDGGSTDDTREIARRYDAQILDNPRRLPEPAKKIGLEHARGKYVMWQDTDEVLLRDTQLEERVNFLRENTEIKCVVCDDQQPGPGCGVATLYLCKCGDPFTQFVYRRRGGVLHTFARNVTGGGKNGCRLAFQPGEPAPIGDGGTTMFDWEWVQGAFPDEFASQQFACSVYSRICEKTGCCGCIPGDDIRHYARAGFRLYLSKLRFRVINNLFHPEESGFAARAGKAEKSNAVLAKRKYWFVLYAATLLPPIFDSVRLAVKYRSATMLLHVVYVYYVCIFIAICLAKKALGKSADNAAYGV